MGKECNKLTDVYEIVYLKISRSSNAFRCAVCNVRWVLVIVAAVWQLFTYNLYQDFLSLSKF